MQLCCKFGLVLWILPCLDFFGPLKGPLYRSCHLKVPKRDNFLLSFFALSEPNWVCDLGTGEKNRIFYQLTPDFDGFWFFAAY